MVLKKFKNEIIKVQKKKYVTFKNQTAACQEIFDYYDAEALRRNLQKQGWDVTSWRDGNK